MFFSDYLEHKEAKLNRNIFWDCPRDMDLKKNRAFVIERIIQRGDFDDIYFMINYFGLSNLIKQICLIRWHEDKRNFISLTFAIPKKKLLCHKGKYFQKIAAGC